VVSDAAPGATQANRKSPPAKVGAAYTGLISDPRAWRGDKPDTLYLQWRRNTDSDVRYYELFRSETADSELAENTLLATVQPGSYVVVPFEERGLKPDTPYYYRVRAVDRDGRKGQPSDVCRGVTHEP
jgi:hypothetical protein